MSRYDFSSQRLFLDAPLAAGARIELDRAQANYLLNVLRMPDAAPVLVFNGFDGEWRARLEIVGRKSAFLMVSDLARAQSAGPDLHYLYAPLKHARLDYMVQKAVEMGAGRLTPVITRRTQASRINAERMRANAIEAAEQCGILTLPEITEDIKLDKLLASWEPDRLLIFCDEDAEVRDPVAALAGRIKDRPCPLAIIIGPEGGFDAAERAALMQLPNVLRLSLGPRILRADTAAVAALALVQAVLGDWR